MSPYRVLDSAGVVDWLASLPELSRRLGGAPADWRVRDVADGNLNSVFLVDGPAGGVCVKQSLPYVRVAGESWPLDVERSRFEVAYFRRIAPFVGPLAPEVYAFDPELRVFALEKLEPHIILRQGLIAGHRYPRIASDLAEFVAQTAVKTSDLAAPFEARARDLQIFSQNLALQRITVDLVFTDPYAAPERNRILPALEPWAAALREDVDVKAAVARLRLAYLIKAQSLLHGDLHTGSIMATSDETKVIDGEFAWVGPTGFDVGNVLAHFVIAWFAKPFHGGSPKEVAAYRAGLESDLVAFWRLFRRRFLELAGPAVHGGDGLPTSHFADAAGAARRATLLEAYVEDVLSDAVGFLAVELIRRILGFAQVADFLVVEDTDQQALAKARALSFARALLLEPQRYRFVATLVASLREFDAAGLDPGLDFARRA